MDIELSAKNSKIRNVCQLLTEVILTAVFKTDLYVYRAINWRKKDFGKTKLLHIFFQIRIPVIILVVPLQTVSYVSHKNLLWQKCCKKH